MDFSWTEEQKIWRRTVRDFAQKKINLKKSLKTWLKLDY